MINVLDDTIAAIATPSGEGGIGIIRISGPKAKSLLSEIFSVKEMEPRRMTYGYIVDPENGETIDEVMAVYMPAPATYTREDVAEINCHGGSIPLSRTLSLILRMGIRMAEPGEFTKRAFLNGRIDLSQAEAVLDVINAKTDASLEAAIDQLQGKFSKEVSDIRNHLVDILVNVGVNIDYPDEDIEEITYEGLTNGLGVIEEEIDNLLRSATSGKILREGLNVAIIGKPNAGKSSLLNQLLREARAIVTDIPGTTRDTIEEFANIRGIPVKITDTAGIRETDDEIEKIGIERSKKSQDDADLVILMVDLSEEIDDEIRTLVKNVQPERTILVFNKIDKEARASEEEVEDLIALPSSDFAEVLRISLMDPDAIKDVEDAIFKNSGYGTKEIIDKNSTLGNQGRSSSIVTNTRHKNMLENAIKSIRDAESSVEQRAPLELIEIDVREAYETLGFITGDSVQGDIIDEIFSRFCLGK